MTEDVVVDELEPAPAPLVFVNFKSILQSPIRFAIRFADTSLFCGQFERILFF